jgi:glycosyltransferase involved in cell wall biosynthesis
MKKKKVIGIDGSRAFLRQRTGIEEYSYQVIRSLTQTLPQDVTVQLYVRKKFSWQNGKFIFTYPVIDFALPGNWQVRGIWAPRFWTKIGLSFEMFFWPVDTLFVPAHTLPLVGGRKNVVTIHGLEYEIAPEAYSRWERFYMRTSIRHSCRMADTIIAVSENTKKDLVQLYAIPTTKVEVVYEGFKRNMSEEALEQHNEEPYLLFVGRIEERKNINRIVRAFEQLKEEKAFPGRLFLVGRPGFGYGAITAKIERSKFRSDIVEYGYVDEEKREKLLRGASTFVFPSLYEGFGLPVLEAQALGIPVVTSQTSSLPEVGGEGVVYVDPLDVTDIARGIGEVWRWTEDEQRDYQEKSAKNLERFSWQRCAGQIADQL